MKKKSLIALMMMSSLLVCCNKTKELYAQGAYDTGDFETNYYLEYNNIDKVDVASETTKTLSDMKVYCPGPNERLENIALVDQTDNGKEDGKLLDWYEDNPKTGVGTKFGPTKSMNKINDKFSYGILSKLYDGRVHCDGYYAKSRVQLNKTGYGTFFPAELKSAKYFGVSIRSTVGVDGFKGSQADVDFHFSFYRHITNSDSYEKYNIEVPMVDIVVSNSDAHGSLLAFYFDTPTLYQMPLDGIVGMSMSFDLKAFHAKDADDIAKYGEPTDDMTDKEKPHFAIYLYEVLFPDSTWL